jgi:CheY-like chemotaxis protein
MLRRGAVAPERTGAILETIERNAIAQAQLVEELLDLSAMTSGGLRLNVTRVDLRELLGGAVETVRPAADAKTLRISLTVDESVREIAADPARIRQVLWNLLANAVKFTPPGGQIKVGVREGPSDVELTVTDTGTRAFRRRSSLTSSSRSGRAICRRCGPSAVSDSAWQSCGTSWKPTAGPWPPIVTGQDQGSTFSVRLPTGRMDGSESPRGPDTLRGRRVLVVDDDESMQELVATMLLMYGVSVRTAGRADQAMEILSEWRPDVLLTDIAMPGENGYALMRRVRAMPPPLGTIPAVALTAYSDPQSTQEAFAAGFDAHLGKPLEPHVLADALSKVLRFRRRGD